MTDNDRLDKIMKLLRKAESTTPEEAELLTEKATELMVRYSIDEAMLAAARGEETPEEIVQATIDIKGVYSMAHMSTAHRIALSMKLRCFYSKASASHIRFNIIGYESDISACKFLFASMQVQCATALSAFDRANPFPGYYSAMEKFKRRRSFITGFADGLGTRLERANKVARADAAAAHGTGMELVLQSKEARVDQWYDEKYGKMMRGRSRGYHVGSGYNDGHRAGRIADTGGSSVSGRRKALGR